MEKRIPAFNSQARQRDLFFLGFPSRRLQKRNE
jgi:hypothetical protein